MLINIRLYFSDIRNNIVSSPKFQKWAGEMPILSRFVRKDGERIYDLMAGFVYSQTLLALVELNVLSLLKLGSLDITELSRKVEIPPDRILRLCQSAVAIGILEKASSDRFLLSRLGAAIIGVPGLTDMIRHHRLFYEDLVDPVGLLKGKIDTKMSKYWPYVLGDRKDNMDHGTAEIYSNLMRTSQKLVAEETLKLVSLSNSPNLLDVGGGNGAFIEEVSKKWPKVHFCLFDLPNVVADAERRTENPDSSINISFIGGDFLTDNLPQGYRTISLIRVLYDHNDDVVIKLLDRIFDALPTDGQIIISEPMSGGKKPTRSGDSYFGFYTMAMTTGRPRSLDDHENFLLKAGFTNIKKLKSAKQFITQVITAEKGR